MKDEVIRIILEAKDKLSNTVRNAEKNINQSFGNIRNDLRNTDKDFEKFSNDFTRNLNKSDNAAKRWSTSIRQSLRSVQDSLSKTRKELEKPIDFGKTERGPRGRFQPTLERRQQRGFGNTGGQVGPREQTSGEILRQEARELSQLITKGPVGRSVVAFNQGRSQAADLEKQLRERIATTKEEIVLQKRALEERIYIEREAIIEDGNIQREQLRRVIVERNKNIDAEILKEKQAEADRQAIRDEGLNKEIRIRNADFEERRKKAEDDLREEIYQRKQLFYDEQFARKQALRDSINEVKQSPLSKNAKDVEIDALKKAESDINRAEQKRRDDDIRALELADDKIKRSDATVRDIDIAEKKAAAAEIRRLDSQETDEKVKKLKTGASEINKEDEAALASELRKRRQAAETKFRALRQGLSTGSNEADIVKEFLEARKAEQALNQDTSRLNNTFRAAGNAFGDFSRGLRRGRSDLREVDNLARQADTGFARFGQSVGKLTKNVGNLVNLKWYILISAIQVLGQLVIVLAANLISLASSAAIAASALGAGLASALSQLIPVAGLLYAAFHRVTAAFTAAQQANKAGAQSSQDARAQAEAQTAAQQQLSDALYAQVQAVKAVADARKQARRDIVDSINAEIDANYALKDAEFAVLDAKEQLRQLEQQNQQSQQAVKDAQAQVDEAKARLKAAKAEGDQAEIEAAQVALAQAQQNLADAKGNAQSQKDRKRQIDEQKLAVKEAEQQVKEAKIAQQRQEQDTARTVRLGVKDNQQVVDALHSVAQANRDVANAQRGVTDASLKQASAGNILQRQLSQLDPAERALYKAFRQIQKTFKDTFRPITDIIVNAVTGAVKRFGVALKNPQILSGFKGLATAIGNGISQLSKYFTSKGFLHDFAGFIHAATSNIPTLVKIIENLTRAFVGLAKAGQPIVKDLLGRFSGVTGKLARAINAPASIGTGIDQLSPQRAQAAPRETQGQAFISKAKTYLDSWIRLADAIGRVFKYLFLDAAPSGNSLINSLTRMFNNLANFLKDNPQKVKKFFDGMVTSLKEISSALFPVVKVLLNAFTGSNAAAFTKFTAQVVVPGLALMLQFTTALAKALLFLSSIPGVKFFLQLLVAEKALNRVFPATQRVTDALKKMGGWFFKAGEDGSRGFTKLWRAMQFTAFRIKYYATLAANSLKTIGSKALEASKNIVKAMLAGLKAVAKFVWEMAVAAVNALKSFAIAVYKQVVEALTAMAAFITDTLIPALIAMGEAMYASLGPWGLVAAAVALIIAGIVLLIRHFHLLEPVVHFIEGVLKDFWKILKDIFGWIKDNWKLITAIMLGPFTLIAYAIFKFKDKIIGFFSTIIDWIKSHWKLLAEIMIAVFLPGGLIILAIYKFKDKIIGVFKEVINFIENAFKKVWKWLSSLFEVHIKIKHFLGIPYPSISFGPQSSDDTSDNANQSLTQGKLAPPPKLPKGIKGFADGGRIPGGDGQAVPIIAHAGEWIVNKAQQMKLATALRTSASAVATTLFGSQAGSGAAAHHGAAHHAAKGKPKKHKAGGFPYDLVSQQDSDGNSLWFIEALNGQFLQLSSSDAAHMIRTAGRWVPKWIGNHGFKLRKNGQAIQGMQRYMAGGVVRPSFAMGGVISSPQSTYGGSSVSTVGGNVHHKKIEQNFNVQTQGETDWNYVMRLATIHAQGSL